MHATRNRNQDVNSSNQLMEVLACGRQLRVSEGNLSGQTSTNRGAIILVHEGDATHDQTDSEARHRGLQLVKMGKCPGMYKQIRSKGLRYRKADG